ncbi:MAG: hypothetical protein HUU16_20980 [Candidatus Omnitrophica bacterium]|nr:hypothetical protein [Candidatus Omnitrophota bacterium]
MRTPGVSEKQPCGVESGLTTLGGGRAFLRLGGLGEEGAQRLALESHARLVIS